MSALQAAAENESLSPEFKVVFNGGKEEMDSATIPVQIGLGEELLAKNPTHILLIEQCLEKSDKVDRDYWRNDRDYGRRQLFRIADGLQFLQFLRAGKHRLGVLVFSFRDDDQEYIKGLLERDRNGRFYQCISWQGLEFYRLYDLPRRSVASKLVEVEVPEALFAKEPETKFSKLVWHYVNWLHSEPPRDECQYRRRKILSIPKVLAVPCYLLYLLFTEVIAKLFRSLLIIFGCAAFFMAGWRTISIRREVWNVLRGRDGWLKAYWRVHPEIRLLWSKSGYPYEKRQYLPFSPIGFLVWVGIMTLAVWSFVQVPTHGEGLYWLGNFASGAGALGFTYFLINCKMQWSVRFRSRALQKWSKYTNLVKKFFRAMAVQRRKSREQRKNNVARKTATRKEVDGKKPEKKKKAKVVKMPPKSKWQIEREREEVARQAHQEFLASNYSMDQVPDKVDLTKPPPVYGSRTHRIVQRFRVGMWAKKGKSCRPFQR